MQKSLIRRNDSNSFSEFSNKLTYEQSLFQDLIQEEFSLKAFENQLKLKENFSNQKRENLHESLISQYKSLEIFEKTQENIDLLKQENTFTVTTGHQLNLLTGPMYFHYKILHTIKLAEELKKSYPDKNFVPIYWMASEDHDFEEINHTFLFNRKISWESNFGGAVGTYPLENWAEFKNEVKQFFNNFPESNIHTLLDKYKGENLSQATFSFVNELFKEYGLVIIDANKKELKREFIPILKQEIENSFSEKAVLEANSKLEKLGFKPQIFARPINLFYLTKNKRIRIINDDNRFQIDELGTFSKDEILKMIEENPENFSPNVVLRPVYQECILPNLAYIGGGAEIAYWTQLKGVFEKVNIPFPLIQVRNSIQIFDKNSLKKASKLGFTHEELFSSIDELKQIYLQKNMKEELDFSELEKQSQDLASTFEKQIVGFDTNLKNYAEAEKTKLHNQVESIKQKLKKLQKSQFDIELKQIEDLKNKLFPNGGLQERHDNFLNFCPDGSYEVLIKELYDAISPFEKDLIVLN
ncbi:MAG: bacillithiol biosynthesis cysteine-adding enzyme BshC [Bacteroidota bacterium]